VGHERLASQNATLLEEFPLLFSKSNYCINPVIKRPLFFTKPERNFRGYPKNSTQRKSHYFY
jgi:hypothetical protein